MTVKPVSEYIPGNRGIYAGIAMQEYLTMPGANRSLLNTVAKRPSHHSKSFPGSDAQTWGTLFNDLLFFGTREYYVQPLTYQAPVKSAKSDTAQITETKLWNGNATVCKKWLAEHTDKPVLQGIGAHSVEWLNLALAKTVSSLRVLELMKDAQFEVTCIGAGPEEYKHPLAKCRPDLMKASEDGTLILADLKTTTDAGTVSFGRQILKHGYHKQAAHCRQILRSLGYDRIKYYFIIVEKGDDPRGQVRRLPDRAMDKGDFDLADEWAVYHKCKLTNNWPDFPDEVEPHQTGEVDLPDYMYFGEDEITPA